MTGARGRPAGSGPAHPLATLVGIAAATLLLVAVVAGGVSWVTARAEARRDAEQHAARLSDLVVGPLVRQSLAGDLRADDELRRAVDARMADGTLRRVMVWTTDGVIVYSTQSALVGRRISDAGDVTAVTAVAAGVPRSEITDADDYHTLSPDRPYVEVQVPLRAVPGLVLEASYDAASVDGRVADLAGPLLAVAVLPLVLLQAIQAPLVVSLVRRVRRGAQERSRLLERALSASDRERREIAADLHDTVVQDLTAAGYALEAVARRIPAPWRDLMDDAVTAVHASGAAVRHTMVDLHPPDLTGPGLPSALESLLDPLRDEGATATLAVAPGLVVDDEHAGALYRIARECLVNVAKHAGAATVRVELTGTAAGVRMRVDDDGIGVPPDVVTPEGHLGLVLVRDRAADLGGTCRVAPRPGGGTRVEVDLPRT